MKMIHQDMCIYNYYSLKSLFENNYRWM